MIDNISFPFFVSFLPKIVLHEYDVVSMNGMIVALMMSQKNSDSKVAGSTPVSGAELTIIPFIDPI